MKVTVEFSPSELAEIQSFTGETKKGPAIRKMVVDALMLKRRREHAEKFISGEWSIDFTEYEKTRALDIEKSKRRAALLGQP